MKPPKTVSARPAGIAPGVKAPTTKTSFSTTYKTKVIVNGRSTNHVFVYHDRGYYDSPLWLALDIALRRADPYYYGNFYDPFSPWFQHPVMIASQCQQKAPPPAGDFPDQAPVNVVINNDQAGAPAEGTSTTVSSEVTTTTIP